MITTFDLRHLPEPPPGGAVVSIGVFDGVHLGHKRLLEDNLARSRELGARATVVTFRRHPKRVLLGRAPRTLTSLEHRLELFRRVGIEHCVALPFDDRLRTTPAEEFVRDVLVGRLGARAFVLGFDSKFGQDRRGTPELLAAMGLDVRVAPKVVLDERAVSSTAIREAVELGDLAGAERMLGRPVTLWGTVVHGRELGRTLGFPTANLNLHDELHPPVGVYACRARIVERRTSERTPPGEPPADLPAVANVGYRPTLDGVGDGAGDGAGADPQVEVHLLDFRGDLYGAVLELAFVERLRGEQRFDGPEALRAAIAADVAAARRCLDARPPAEPPAEPPVERGGGVVPSRPPARTGTSPAADGGATETPGPN